MKRKATISFDWWKAEVEVDTSEQTIKHMKEQILFWANGKQRIYDEDGDVLTAYLKMLGEELLTIAVAPVSVESVILEFKDLEGWAPLDGSFGAKLLSIDQWEFVELEVRIANA